MIMACCGFKAAGYAGLLAALSYAQSGAIPSFRSEGVVLANGGHATLGPGLILSLYGTDLGPAGGCVGRADPQRRETPGPSQTTPLSTDTSLYPIELCGVKVLVGDVPAGLLYVGEKQINFKVPREVPLQGTGEIRVIFNGRGSLPVSLPFGLDSPAIALENPAAVGMPVWLKVRLPYGRDGGLRYPIGIHPADFGCYEVEVRRAGKMLARFADLQSQAFNGITGSGNPCGFIGLPKEPQHQGRLPLHLQYRFDQPGVYEVRLTTRRPMDAAVSSIGWTAIEIQPAAAQQRARWMAETAPPPDAVEALTDYLPGILGVPDDRSLALVERYLYHEDSLVRQYAMFGLTYWPAQRVNNSVWELMRARGPSDAIITFLTRSRDFTAAHADSMVEAAIPYLTSSSPVLLRGAVTAVTRIAITRQFQVSPSMRSRSEDVLIRAADHIVQAADPQTVTDYAAALGQAADGRASEVLWKLVDRNIEQASIALCWRKDPADLPRLADLALLPAHGRSLDYKLASLPYALRNAYGEASLPYLEKLLNQSEFTWVRLESAKELMLAGRASGFRFAAEAIEHSVRPYWRELIDFVRFSLPGQKEADDAAILRYVKERAAQ